MDSFMCKTATLRRLVAVLLSLGGAPAFGQVPDWHHIGNSLMDLSLAGLASGPVNRVWYSPDGSALFAATSSGRVFQTNDFDTWQALPDGTAPPPRAESGALSRRLPELGASVRNAIGQGSAWYAF